MTINQKSRFSYSNFILALAMASSVTASQAETLLTAMDFETGPLTDGNGWVFGAQSGAKLEIALDADQNHSLKASYPITTGAIYAWAVFDLTKYNTRDIYVEFDAKMPDATEGIKFFKIFSKNVNNGEYANTTFGLSSDAGQAGSLTYIGFGDGTNKSNDVNNIILLSGNYPNWIGRSYGKAKLYTIGHNWNNTDWKQNWHHFKIHAKFNTATYDYTTETCQSEINDGEYLLEIDGVKYVEASGLFNRHCRNYPLERIEFFNWGDKGVSPFTVSIDNIRVTTGGFTSSTSSGANPPRAPKAKIVAQ